MTLDDQQLQRVIAEVLRRVKADERTPGPARPLGVFRSVDDAVAAAEASHRALVACSLETRREIIARIRQRAAAAAADLARDAREETGLGRVKDKIAKNLLAIHKTPGIEMLRSQSFTGDGGLTLVERAPHGVIGSITPCTNATETLINNGIGMVAGGNAVVFNPHPAAQRVAQRCIDLMNRASVEAGGPEHLFTCVASPSIQSATELMHHPGIDLLVVTGGGGVVRAAMASGKKCIAAGPGNPPVVVDATASVEQAGTGIVRGASFDNNVICTDEKEVFAVDGIFDAVAAVMRREGAVFLDERQTDALEALVFPGGSFDRSLVGLDAGVYLERIGVPYQGDPRLVVCEVPRAHRFVQEELLMPILGMVRCPDVESATAWALEAEHGCRHTASMYSRDLDALHRMARAFDGSIFVKNAPNYAGLGFGGEGWTSWTIASPTGEGLTTCLDFTRVRRCTLAGYFRIV